MTIRAAQSLTVALAQLNMLAPNRSKASDGGIASHTHSRANPTSDHEADASGTYHARDFTHDPANGADMSLYPMRLIADPRAKYVIFNDKFYDRDAFGRIRVRAYALVNPKRTNKHDKHLHLSVHGGALGEDGRQWEAFTIPRPTPIRKVPSSTMYILCKHTDGRILYGIYSGGILIGIGTTAEIDDATRAMSSGAVYQWVEPWTWDLMDRRGQQLCGDIPTPASK